jgi:hypothetical protein
MVLLSALSMVRAHTTIPLARYKNDRYQVPGKKND